MKHIPTIVSIFAFCVAVVAVVIARRPMYLPTSSVEVSAAGSSDDYIQDDGWIGIPAPRDTTINWQKFRQKMLLSMYPKPEGWDSLTPEDKNKILDSWDMALPASASTDSITIIEAIPNPPNYIIQPRLQP